MTGTKTMSLTYLRKVLFDFFKLLVLAGINTTQKPFYFRW